MTWKTFSFLEVVNLMYCAQLIHLQYIATLGTKGLMDWLMVTCQQQFNALGNLYVEPTQV